MERPRGWRDSLYRIIFESDTPSGRAFDIVLITAILLSVTIIILESLPEVREVYGGYFMAAEWFFTILFTIEYALRLMSAHRPIRYAFSFYGLVDLIAVAPTYLSALIPGAQYFLVVRMLRILRIFRVLKLVEYLNEAGTITRALRASRRKIEVFIVTVFTMVVILGSLMYLVEGPENGFTSIPLSIYWAIVTLTTVGYGDISPQTALGQGLAAIIMLLGYGIIAVPTGIVTNELARSERETRDVAAAVVTAPCPRCSFAPHDADARFCKACGERLEARMPPESRG